MLVARSLRRPRGLVLAGLLLASSCAGPRFGPAHELPEQAAAVLATPPPAYGAAGAPASPEGAKVRGTFQASVPAGARPLFMHDPALDLVAAAIAGTLSDSGQAPSHALVQWLFWRAGAVGSYARLELMTAESPEAMDRLTAEYASRIQPPASREAFGIGRFQRGGTVAQAIVVARRPLDVEPLAKSHAPGATVTVRVRPVEAYADFVLHASGPGDAVTEEKMTQAADGTASIEHKLPTQPGRYFLEVSALEPRIAATAPENPWRRTILWVPVYVGVPEPAAPDAFIQKPQPSPADSATWSTRVVEVYNQARAAAGKNPLAVDGRLTGLAQERSGVLGRAAREPPPDVVLPDKLAAAGSPPRDYDEWSGRADSPTEYAALRLLVPSARKRLVTAESLLLGVGLTARPQAAPGERSFTLVEEIVEPAPRMEPAKARARVLAALDAHATAQGRQPFQHDDDVSKVVQGFADEVCKGIKRPNQTKTLIDKARGVGEKFHSWGNANWRAGYDFTRWEDASILAKVKEPPLTHAAVGICQGDLPAKPQGSYVVVVQFGM